MEDSCIVVELLALNISQEAQLSTMKMKDN